MKYSGFLRTALVALALTSVFAACFNQYTAGTFTSQSQYPKVIEKARKDKRSMMLHSGINLYSITSVQVDRLKKQMTVQLDMPDSSNRTDANNTAVGTVTPKASGQAANPQLHIHMSDSTSYTLDEPHTLPMDKVAKIEVVE